MNSLTCLTWAGSPTKQELHFCPLVANAGIDTYYSKWFVSTLNMWIILFMNRLPWVPFCDLLNNPAGNSLPIFLATRGCQHSLTWNGYRPFGELQKEEQVICFPCSTVKKAAHLRTRSSLVASFPVQSWTATKLAAELIHWISRPSIKYRQFIYKNFCTALDINIFDSYNNMLGATNDKNELCVAN